MRILSSLIIIDVYKIFKIISMMPAQKLDLREKNDGLNLGDYNK